MAHDGDMAGRDEGAETIGPSRPIDLRVFLDHARAVAGAPIAVMARQDVDGRVERLSLGVPEAPDADAAPLSDLLRDAAHAAGRPFSIVNMRRAAAGDDPGATPLAKLAARGVGAAIAAPLRDSMDGVCGAVALLSPRPRPWRDLDAQALRVAAAGVEAALGLREAVAAQEEILQEMLALNEALSTQSADLSMARMTAERALQRQTSFLAGLSHELRTPLNGVLGGLSLLDGAPDADRRAQYQKMIRASAKTLGECVDDLLTYCRLGAGIDAPEFTAFDPRAVAAEAVESASAFAAEKGLIVRAEIDEATPAEWMSDGRRIGKLLVNLLGNAVKYTAEGGVALSIAPMAQDLAFRVVDSGRGVPPAMAEAIFEPFNRGDPDTARSAQGTGLGLAIARETAQRLGGSLTLERSALGKGSTFLLRVPRRETLTAGDDALFGG